MLVLRLYSYVANYFSSSETPRRLLVNNQPPLFIHGLSSERFSDSNNSLASHRGNHKDQESSLMCRVCSMKFKTSEELKCHNRNHTGREQQQHLECETHAKTKSNLKRDHTIHSAQVKPFKCAFCSLAFKTSSSLKQHHLVHSDERPFNCNICSADFKTSSYLKTHHRVCTQRWASLQVQHLLWCLQNVQQFEMASSSAQRWASLQMQNLLNYLQDIQLFEGSSSNTQWWTTIRMQHLLSFLQNIQQFEQASPTNTQRWTIL